ncbi:putative replication factor c small subunit [Acanthamoeba polyphaga mimivirus]|uniref:Replication factor c small subunit n=1 Tax=Acanthamoeba polyphaga mimivirus Kroon TaxID=3069720 RepID=A0A0G2Y399_9VIRU|nr:putative replication factor c small subunit [Acanthamoeba polyphaga mimivirus]AKI80243.1 putative replication factor c small subunit [Acanthamoeba polyphaga mimivirus Kroon]
MIDDESVPWIEKYRPKKLEDITQSQNLLDLFKNSTKKGEMTHFLFYGPPGTGKTSAILAMGREIFKEHFRNRVIEFNASDDRGINAVREKITNEAKKYVAEIKLEDGTIIPSYKIIILDEADSMTDEAQDALRVIIEQYSTATRFCFICNYITKITDAIKSRCSSVYFKKLSDECMVEKLNDISLKESMDLPKNILHTIIDVSNGDMRKAIMLLQNFKYTYNFKKNLTKKLEDMTLLELKTIFFMTKKSSITSTISEEDVYEISASITLDKAKNIINDTIDCNNIVEVSNLSKKIISMGFPIDNILTQLNKCILESNKLDVNQISKIIIYSGDILLKMKECGNEYIQLLNYLAYVNRVSKHFD